MNPNPVEQTVNLNWRISAGTIERILTGTAIRSVPWKEQAKCYIPEYA